MSKNDDERIKALSGEEAEKLLEKEAFRISVNKFIDERIDTVDFMKKVREYAGMEIDSRIFKSSKYWITMITTAVVTSLIGVLISRFIK